MLSTQNETLSADAIKKLRRVEADMLAKPENFIMSSYCSTFIDPLGHCKTAAWEEFMNPAVTNLRRAEIAVEQIERFIELHSTKAVQAALAQGGRPVPVVETVPVSVGLA